MNKVEKKVMLNKMLCYIKDHLAENGYPPSLREISEALSIKSTSTVFAYIEELKNKGLITKAEQKTRSIALNKNDTKIVKVPLLGEVAAGLPILAEENIEDVFFIPKNLFPEDDLYMLNVAGDSMIDAGIFNGDKIIVKKQSYAKNGEIIVALINDESATVKRYYKQDNSIVLKPENPNYADMIFDSIQILGRVVGVIRKI